jgi:membrane protein implicated in regulation of membrane protease activity
MEFTLSIYWLLTGLIFISIEVFGLPSVGFLFAGLAAIVISLLIEGAIFDGTNTMLTFGTWFLLTTMFGALLWKPMKKWRTTQHSATKSKNGVIGQKAIIYGKDLSPNELGSAQWSGTIMNARLHPDDTATLNVGTTAIIHAVEGNTLILSTSNKE